MSLRQHALNAALAMLSLVSSLDQRLTRIERILTLMAATQAQLDAALAQENTDLNGYIQAVSALIAKLSAGTDYSSELATVQAMDTAIQSANTGLSTPASTGTPTGAATVPTDNTPIPVVPGTPTPAS